ncbi:magnesium/cobalt transporter CorA [Candidatus Omnitrophota bacterium]
MYETILYKKDKSIKTGLNRQEIEDALKDRHSLLWVDMKEADDENIELLTSIFKLHPLTIEDCIMPNARPKLEKFDNYLFMIAYAIELDPGEEEELKTVELDCCLGHNYLITVHRDDMKSVNDTKDKAQKKSPVITNGPDFLLCSVVDAVVDNYFPIISMFDDRGDDMSDELFKEPTQETLNKIYNLKNEIMFLRRTVAPQADIINLILRGGFELITQSNLAYFRNVYDNLVRLNDVIATARDTITSALEVYVSVISNRSNEIMKTLTLIASIYGMNFKYMPELSSRYGYPAVIGIMIFIAVIMLTYFKRRKWL